MKKSINPELQNPIRFDKNVGEAEGPREFYFDPYTGDFGTLYTYEGVGQQGDYENHGSLSGAIPINEHSKSAMLTHYWQATVVERTQIRIDAGFDDEEVFEETAPEDIDVIEQFDGERVSKDEREQFDRKIMEAQMDSEGDPPPTQQQQVHNGMPVIPVDLGEYVQTRDIIRAQEIGLKVLIPMLQNKLDPEAPEHEIVRVLVQEIERSKGIIYEE